VRELGPPQEVTTGSYRRPIRRIARASSTIIDIAELTEDGLIASLHIVYDTAPIRGDFEQAKRTESPENISG
jgi:hypothetical protein